MNGGKYLKYVCHLHTSIVNGAALNEFVFIRDFFCLKIKTTNFMTSRKTLGVFLFYSFNFHF
jgi:hypothetical protein